MKNPRWRGIFPAVTTKFHADESLDLEGTARHLDFQIRNGIHGLVTGGSLGEASTLSLEEKLLVAKNALAVSKGRVPVPATTSINFRFCTSLVDTSRCSMGVIHW